VQSINASKWWYADVHKSEGWKRKSTSYYPETSTYRTLGPLLLPALKASFPAFEFLMHLTRGYKQRSLVAPAKIYEDPKNEHLLVWIGAPGRGRLFPRDMAGVRYVRSACCLFASCSLWRQAFSFFKNTRPTRTQDEDGASVGLVLCGHCYVFLLLPVHILTISVMPAISVLGIRPFREAMLAGRVCVFIAEKFSLLRST
jgi:hypothetical protein